LAAAKDTIVSVAKENTASLSPELLAALLPSLLAKAAPTTSGIESSTVQISAAELAALIANQAPK